MHTIFTSLYTIFSKSKRWFATLLVLSVIGMAFLISKIKLEEDISALIPMDDRISEMSETFSNSKFADQIIFIASMNDSTDKNADRLIQVIDSLGSFLAKDSLVKNVRKSVDESATIAVYDYFYRNLPYYMSDTEYAYLDTIVESENLTDLMKKNYRSIIAPTGFGASKYILKDPLSLVPRFLERLKAFQLDKNFTLYKSHIFTKDKKHILCFVDPTYSSKNTKQNRLLIDNINAYLNSSISDDVNLEYYGGTAVAVANANRVQKDILITISIAVLLLLLLFLYVFRKIKVLLFLFLPVVLGVGVALSILSLINPTLSAISLGVGAILVGISIDFSLHYFSHVRFGHSAKEILNDISNPVIMSSLTTASAFLCLNVVNSQALNQLGLFAGLSVISASVFVLICLPLLFKKKDDYKVGPTNQVVDQLASFNFHRKKAWIVGVLLASVVLYFTGQTIRFDADIAKLNYLPSHLQKAEQKLKTISSEASSAIYIVVSDSTINGALNKLEQNQVAFDSLALNGIIGSMSSPSILWLSKEKQMKQLDRWNSFWASKGVESTVDAISAAGEANHFKSSAFKSFYQVLAKPYDLISDEDIKLVGDIFLSNLVNHQNNQISLVSVCKVDQSKKNDFFNAMALSPDLLVLDKQFFTNKFFEVLKDDFTKLINYSMVVVFLIVLIFWGRIELALITFIPIVLSWQWTIGLMGIFDVHFNIFNIIICTFIFGLGIDYSIFLTQGLINNYKYGSRSILPYKTSILLSVATTLIGVGVLIFAEHPALKSIAMVTVIGIISVIIITFTILPFLFKLLVHQGEKKREFPIVAVDILVSILSFIVFLIGVIVLSVMVLMFRITPFATQAKKKLIHYLVSLTCKVVVGMNFLFRKKYLDQHKFDLSKPAVITCNHQSHLDIALLLLLNPKIIVLTNQWVWKNPFYGFIIRYIDFYPIYTGIDQGYEKIKQKVDQGYSVLIFPEGTRTKNGKINRFHQGAFSLADYLGIDILPVIIHGAYECMPKTEFFLRSGRITLKFFDRVKVDPIDIEKGITYRPQAKRMTTFYREQFQLLKNSEENVDFYQRRVINQFVYKGPVLEWYLRVKIRLEKNYRFYDELIPKKGKIIDIGCGYGFLAHMLSYTSKERKIIGWDYDEEKIGVAQEVASESDRLDFMVKDVVQESFEKADVFVFNDVLHYFSAEKQKIVLNKAYDDLNEGGMIVIRDADTELYQRTKVTKLTEWFSIKFLRFNQMKYELSFVSSTQMMAFANDKNMNFEKVDNAKYTSNLTYVLTKKH